MQFIRNSRYHLTHTVICQYGNAKLEQVECAVPERGLDPIQSMGESQPGQRAQGKWWRFHLQTIQLGDLPWKHAAGACASPPGRLADHSAAVAAPHAVLAALLLRLEAEVCSAFKKTYHLSVSIDV